MWAVPRPETQPTSTALGRQILYRGTTREVPRGAPVLCGQVFFWTGCDLKSRLSSGPWSSSAACVSITAESLLTPLPGCSFRMTPVLVRCGDGRTTPPHWERLMCVLSPLKGMKVADNGNLFKMGQTALHFLFFCFCFNWRIIALQNLTVFWQTSTYRTFIFNSYSIKIIYWWIYEQNF